MKKTPDIQDFISDKSKKVDSSGIRKVFDLAQKIEDPINLSIGQPDFDVPEEIKKEAIKAIELGFNKYTLTQGIEPLREKLADFVNKRKKTKYSKDECIITSGVSGGITLVLMALLNDGDEVIIFDPYFVMYKHLTNLFGGKPIIINTYPDFELANKKDEIEGKITDKTKLILINSPANPTGKVLSREDIQTVYEIAKKYNLLVVSDEIYDEFVYDVEYTSIASMYPERTILLGGFSKTYAMTGWRIGYAFGPSPIIKEMIKLQQYTFVCAPSFAQYASIKALDYDMSDYIKKYKLKRNMVVDGLNENFDITKPEGAFYSFPAPKDKNINVQEFVNACIEEGVLIIPGNVFSERNTNFRLSFAASDKNIERGIEKINKIYKKFTK
ncbi:MAG: pyridoxal phosphate-dependent aminotransferase [Brevinematales bacterium]|nr:pyridoxal phosphate-dependent aminotransferase [Brevinematales bacterium]